MSTNRSTNVENFLKTSGHSHTVREICWKLSYSVDQAKFVSRLLTNWLACGKVSVCKTRCSHTNRKVNAYAWSMDGAQAWKQRTRAQRKSAKPKAATEEERRAELYRKAADEARKRREEFFLNQQQQDQITRAWIAFGQMTGCGTKSEEAVRQAYRQAALQHHPDRGGDKEAFIKLATAYSAIKASF